jgi:hypothetical protein
MDTKCPECGTQIPATDRRLEQALFVVAVILAILAQNTAGAVAAAVLAGMALLLAVLK